MKSHELMLISVYPEMLEDIQAVCQTMHIEPTILQWEIAQQGPSFGERGFPAGAGFAAF